MQRRPFERVVRPPRLVDASRRGGHPSKRPGLEAYAGGARADKRRHTM